jgi:type II secretory pathway pseudopilin PulG
MRMMRDTANQVTRTANDAIQAYRRANSAVTAELAKPNGDHGQAQQTRNLLRAARAELLRVLELTSRRYAWTTDGSQGAGAVPEGADGADGERVEPTHADTQAAKS